MNKIAKAPAVVPVNESMNAAAKEIKENMTEVQKSALYLKEGKLLMENGNFAAAIECLSEAISINPHNSNIFLARASCYKSIQMFAEAYFDYSFLIKLEPLNGAHYCSRGLCSSKLKRIALALEDLDAAVDAEPSAIHLYSRGTVHSECNNFELAIKDLSRAIMLQDDQQQSSSEFKLRCFYRRASVYCDLKKYTAAMKDLMVILIQDPEMVHSRVLLGKALKMSGELGKAEEQMVHVIRMESDMYSHHAELGDIRFLMREKSKLKLAVKDFAKAVALLEQQNERSLKAINTRVAAQSHVESMKANATALKVTSMDRAVVTTNSLESSSIPSLGACDSRFLVEFEAKAKPMVRKLSMVDKHRRASRKNPRLRALSFCTEIGNFSFADIAPITRELVRQGHIKDMLMRKLKGGTGSFAENLAPLVGSVPPEVPTRGVSSMSEKSISSLDNRKSISLATGRNNSITSINSRSSYTSCAADGTMKNLYRGMNTLKDKGRRSTENSEMSVSDASDDSSSSDDDDGETYCPSPPASGPVNTANSVISQAMAESHEQLADILFRRSQALLMLSDSARDGDSDPDVEYEGDARGGPRGLREALRDALRASEFIPEDLEYRLLVAACYLRLEEFTSAMNVLQYVLDISPNNEKALFHYTFCLRALKREKEAIECLTQIISSAWKERERERVRERERYREDDLTSASERDLGSVFSVPLGRVYEMRGTMLMETQAFELACTDLSSAVKLDPQRAGNYFLRGTCRCKLREFKEVSV